MGYFLGLGAKVLLVIALLAVGALAKRLGLLSDQGEEDLSRVMVDIFWPALIFVSITRNIDAADLAANFSLPLLALLTGLTGYGLAVAVAGLARFRGDRRKIFVFHGAVNNFAMMPLPFVEYLFPRAGAALLFIHNIGMILVLWVLGVGTLRGGLSPRETLRSLLSPGLVVTVVSILLVATGANRAIPPVAYDLAETIGAPTLLVGMMVAGARIYVLGRGALKFDRYNLLVGLIRLVLVPGLLFLAALAARPWFKPESLAVFCLVNLAPCSINSVTMAIKYRSDPGLAAEGLVFTHLFAMLVMPLGIWLIERMLI